MYAQGEEKYLKDLDCVSIVKSIRELKALARVILSQQQRQLLAFERDSVLPSNKTLEEQEAKFIHSKVPFQDESAIEWAEYAESVDKCVAGFYNKPLSDVDIQIINEVVNENDWKKLNSAQIFNVPSKQLHTEQKVRSKFKRR